jgi:hypothetical protein
VKLHFIPITFNNDLKEEELRNFDDNDFNEKYYQKNFLFAIYSINQKGAFA